MRLDDPKLLKKYRLNDKSAKDFEKQYNIKLELLYYKADNFRNFVE